MNRAATDIAVADVAMTIFQVVLKPFSLPLELELDETDVTVVVTTEELEVGFTPPLWEAAALDPVCVTDNVDVTLPPPVCPLVDLTLVVPALDVEESVVTEVEESVVGPVVVVGGGVVVHGPGVHDGFTGTVHVLVDVQSVKVMSSEARQQSATSFAITVPWLNSSPAMNGLCVKLTPFPPEPPYEIVLMPSPMSKISNFVVTTVMLQSHCVTPLQLPMTFVMLQSGGVVSGVLLLGSSVVRENIEYWKFEFPDVSGSAVMVTDVVIPGVAPPWSTNMSVMLAPAASWCVLLKGLTANCWLSLILVSISVRPAPKFVTVY